MFSTWNRFLQTEQENRVVNAHRKLLHDEREEHKQDIEQAKTDLAAEHDAAMKQAKEGFEVEKKELEERLSKTQEQIDVGKKEAEMLRGVLEQQKAALEEVEGERRHLQGKVHFHHCFFTPSVWLNGFSIFFFLGVLQKRDAQLSSTEASLDQERMMRTTTEAELARIREEASVTQSEMSSQIHSLNDTIQMRDVEVRSYEERLRAEKSEHQETKAQLKVTQEEGEKENRTRMRHEKKIVSLAAALIESGRQTEEQKQVVEEYSQKLASTETELSQTQGS